MHMLLERVCDAGPSNILYNEYSLYRSDLKPHYAYQHRKLGKTAYTGGFVVVLNLFGRYK